MIVMRAKVLALLLAVPLAAFANDPQFTTIDANTVRVRIDQPNVTQRSTDYPTVKFQPGDTVTVNAGGCVQTGGSGSTWKRYVDPSGDNSDRLYHGRIQIPTATQGLETVQGVMRRSPVHVANPAHPADLAKFYLTLGYDDDQYNDNGYYSHDDGTEDQCKNVGNAWVELTIVHAQAPVVVGPKAPMDQWWTFTDDNLAPLNPVWGIQVDAQGNPTGRIPDPGALCNNFHDEDDSLKLGNPPCTTQQPTVDEPNGWNDPVFWAVCQASGGVSGAVHGHINWGIATFTGVLDFSDHSKPVPSGTGDDDYDMALIRSDQASTTVNNEVAGGVHHLGLEFDSDETIDAFDTPWWKDFHSAVDSDDTWAKAQGMINGADAIVTGLIGIDNKHDPHAELHPVLGLMARVPNRSTPTSDFWVFFARPQGDEGGCSQDLHQFINMNTMEFLLPLGSAVNPNITASNVRAGRPGASWSATQYDDGLLIAINFPPVVAAGPINITPVVWGELTITHTGVGQAQAQALFGPLRGMAQHGLTANRVLPRNLGTAPPGSLKILGTHPGNVNIKVFEMEQDSYLDPLAAQLTQDEWNKFVTAYQNPPPANSSAKPPVINSSKTSFLRTPTNFAKTRGIVAASLVHPTVNVPRSMVKVPRRHRALGKTDPRNLLRPAVVLNHAQILEHQQMAKALQTAVGQVRARALLQSADKPAPTASRVMQIPW